MLRAELLLVTGMTTRIERARVDDGPAILQLLTDSGLPTDGLLDHLTTAIVARVDRRVVGCAALEIYPDGALLRSVAVAAGEKGKGIGSQLTNVALNLARTHGMPAIYLLTTRAENFFSKFDFEPVARADVPVSVQTSVEFRSACPATAVVMRCVLKPSHM